MPISRRTLLTGAATAALAPSLAQAAMPIQDHQAPGFYRFKLGDYEVTIRHDGARTVPLPASFVSNVPPDQAAAAASDAFMPAGKVTVPFNPTLGITALATPGHTPFAGHVERVGNGYRLVPVAWSSNL